MKINTKISLGFLVIICLIMIVALFALSTYRGIYLEFDMVKENVIPGVISMVEMKRQCYQITYDLMRYLQGEEEINEEEVIIDLAVLEKIGQDHLECKKLIKDEDVKEAKKLIKEAGKIKSAIMGIIKLKKQGVDVGKLYKKQEEDIYPLIQALSEQIEEHKAVHIEALAKATEKVHAEYVKGIWLLLIMASFVLLFSVVITLVTKSSIVRPLKVLQKGVEVIGKGNLDYRVDINTEDEIGELSRVFDKMTRNLKRTTTGIAKLTKEVAHRKKIEEELRESRKRFRSLVETTSDWIWEVDRNGVYTYASPKVEALLGYIPEEVIGKTPFNLMPAEEAERVTELFRAFIESRKSFQALENTNLHKDGRRVVLETSGVPIFDDSGEFVGYRGIDRDITERKRAQEEIRRAAQEWRTTFDSITDMVSIHDKDSKLLRVNKAFANAFGAEPEELIGKACYEVVHGTKKPWPECPMKQMLETKKPVVVEFFEPRLGIYLEVSGSPILNEEDEFVAFVHVTKDITERKRAEKLLRQQTHDLSERVKEINCLYGISKLMETPDIILAQIFSGITNLIPSAWQYPDITCARITFEGRQFNTNNFKKTPWRQVANITISGKKAGVCEVCYLKKKPEFDEGPFRQSERELLNVIAERLGKIIQRLKGEDALKESESKFRHFFENEPEYCYIISPEAEILDVNDTALKALEYEKKELVGKPLKIIYAPESLPKMEELFAKWKQTETFRNEEIVILTKKGDRRTVLLSTSVVKDRDGKILYSVSLQRDITEGKRIEEELKRTLAELERSNAELEEFAYVASHDLQEPLRMVSSYLQLIERRYKNRLDKDADEFIAFAVDGATRMQKMINKLLLYSRIGKQSESLKPIDCEDILDQVVANLAAAIQESGVIVTRDPLPTVMANDALLIELLQNLIGNAVKFRGKKSPGVHVKAEKKGSDWVFSVRDNGIGVDPRHAGLVFQIFQRLHGRSEYPGTGIGLAICRRIVEYHGGNIWLESEPTKGSTFYFSIPVAEGKKS